MTTVSILAAALIGLGPRPGDFVGPDLSAYGGWLAAEAIAADERDAGASCPMATVQSLGGSPGGPPFLKAPPPDEFVDSTVVEHVQVDGCGRSHRLNYLVFRTTAGRWMAARMLDGESRAGALLQRDALRSAVMAFVVGAHCKDADEAKSTLQIGGSKVLRPPAGDGSWDELWTATICGRTVGAKVSFTPDAVGGGANFSISAVPPDGQPPPPPPRPPQP